MEQHQWDVFISHASEDKEEVARPLAKALRQAGLQVWYDEFMIKAGDNINRFITQGQNESAYGLIILSPHFFANERWAQDELDGFVVREIYLKQKIIPVWHHVTIHDVLRFSAKLATRKAITTDKGLDSVVQEILSLFDSEGKEEVIRTNEPINEAPPVREIPPLRLRSAGKWSLHPQE